ncbi:hypothetical protein M199_gp056 [Halogranum tailed virus 1]|uniref:Uncharacterized protein n=1 Tax=Halogranum tailed virus 1 TaxID=1273749 RepID=R4T9K4_9CAUD|nr:hypothetical protein M199_gp056 [Halogranum tailed virus 1]AGM11610.1 hypothetical protein HGTV1_313 [Halogranum tailed virus 1]
MGQITQADAEKSAENVAATVSEICEENDIFFAPLESDMIGVRKPAFANFARQVREGNAAFRSWSLPAEKGAVNQTNRSVFTARFVNFDYTIPEAVSHLIESGQFEDSVSNLMEYDDDLSREVAEAVMSYNLYIVAKGWLAESQVADMSGISKLWESNDLAGQDFQEGETFIQLKSFTHGIHGLKFDGNAELRFYGWVGDKIVVSDDYTDVTKKLQETYMVNFDDLRDYEWFHSL